MRIISWNIRLYKSGPLNSIESAVAGLKEEFDKSLHPTVIILNNVHYELLLVLHDYPWIKDNFLLSNVLAPSLWFPLALVSKNQSRAGMGCLTLLLAGEPFYSNFYS